MSDEADIFWGRCTVKTPEQIAASPFVYDHELPQPHWRADNTCSHCGGLRPTLALAAIRAGSVVIPTDKNYKFYLEGHRKVYFNHFSEAQAVEFVLMLENHQMNLEHPGHFYSGLCFGVYKDAIEKALEKRKAEIASTGTAVTDQPPISADN